MPKENDRYELPESQIRAVTLIEEMLGRIPRTDSRQDPRLQELREKLLLLRHQLEVDERQMVEAMKVIAEYEEAYAKLTSPANRLAVFLERLDDDTATIALGETEFVCLIDPKLEDRDLRVGTRVKVNEAYAIIGDMGPHPGGPVVKVSETLDGDRLRVSSDPTGTQGRLVIRSDDLKEAVIQPGDEVRMEPNFRVALQHFPREEARDYYFEDVPEIPWCKVGGQEHAIELIKDTIELPLLHPELFEKFDKKPIKGILLYGPPGCGKTLIGKATAYNLTREYSERMGKPVQEYFMYINGPKILNMWLGETERMVREIFSTARLKAREGYLVFIFIDEAESILRTRSSGRWLNISNTVVPQFAAEMDGLVAMENVVVILTSNRPDYIDPAILRPERIDRKVKINRPDKKASREILGIYLAPHIPLDPQMVEEYAGDREALRECLVDSAVEYLWRKAPETEFLQVFMRSGSSETLHWKDLVSGALLKSVIDRAKDFAIKRAIAAIESGVEHGLRLDDITEAIRVEYKENEIFPKTDTQDDWLKLLDYEPENVAVVKPIKPGGRERDRRRSVI